MANFLDLPYPHPKRLPTSAEVSQCKAAIEDLDQAMRRVLEQIYDLKVQLRSIARKRGNYLSFITSFRRLPVEILSNIALLCLNNGTSITILTSINSHFRDTIIGMPSLWRAVYLTSGDYERGFAYSSIDKGIICTTRNS
ncbi:hypothetical protein CPB86DRAFT_626001 [Serendipita vermifera]|nr:hypothetical protein CPB86DRAFT_626001 [Serendipita vermifera]